MLEKVNVRFRDDNHLMQIIDRIVARVGRRVGRKSSPDGRRAPARRLARQRHHSSFGSGRTGALDPPFRQYTPADRGAASGNRGKHLRREMLEVLKAAVRARTSILISGGTGAGKTTFLNMLSKYIPESERLVTIEDAAELQLQQENVVRLETRPPNVEGKGAVRQRHLLINCLRMRPDRIIVGEVRGDEAFDMLQAMNTGHEGSMTTIHANTCRDALSRLESMVAMSNLSLPDKAVRQQIAAAIGIVVQISRMSDGNAESAISVAEITGMDQEVISMQDIFTFTKKGIGPSGKVVGLFQPTRIRPKFARTDPRIGAWSCPRKCSEHSTESEVREFMSAVVVLVFIGVFAVVLLLSMSFDSSGVEARKKTKQRLESISLAAARSPQDEGVGLDTKRRSSAVLSPG